MLFFNKNFSDINPTCYAISTQKEIFKRIVKDILSGDKFAKIHEVNKLPYLISSYSSKLIKTGRGIDPVLQENKAVNIDLACRKINGIIIDVGEVFSFWHTVGKTSRKNGYKDGRVIIKGKLQPGLGGGLCNLAHTINRMILDSTLDVTEFHKHSDALAPDHGERVPFIAGTSISYNYIDYRCKNNTNQRFQLCLWCEDGVLYGELRSDLDIPYRYEYVEEEQRFEKKDDKYIRRSTIYRKTINKENNKEIRKELIWDNKSEVMFDYDLIPKKLINEVN